MFDNPDILQQLLGSPGTSADGAQPPPSAMPMPKQSAPPMPPQSTFDPTTPDYPANGSMPLPRPRPRPASAPQVGSLPLPPADPRLSNASMPPPSSGPGPTDYPTIGPGMLTPPAPPLDLSPPNEQQAAAPISPPMGPNGPGAAQQPPAAPLTAAQQSANRGGLISGPLARAFGIDPMQARNTLAGIGKGLSAAGTVRPGTPAAAAFATGAGGSLTGAEQQRQQMFTESSTAFKDMMAAKNSDNTEAYRQAQGKYLLARAASLTAGGTGKGSNAWQNTDYGKTIQVENEAQKYEKGQQILLAKRWAANGATPEQQQKDIDQLSKNVDSYRQRLYKQIGIDPSKADKLKDMGTSAANPFDTKGMSIDQFHSQVPMGAWYKDQNGVPRQRTVPPPGVNMGDDPAQPSQPAQPAPNAGTNIDDQTAMQTAA